MIIEFIFVGQDSLSLMRLNCSYVQSRSRSEAMVENEKCILSRRTKSVEWKAKRKELGLQSKIITQDWIFVVIFMFLPGTDHSTKSSTILLVLWFVIGSADEGDGLNATAVSVRHRLRST